MPLRGTQEREGISRRAGSRGGGGGGRRVMDRQGGGRGHDGGRMLTGTVERKE